MSTFKEGDNTADTVSFTGCTDSTVIFDLTNSGTSETISKANELDLELKRADSTLTLTFQVDTSVWPSASTVAVRLDGGPDKPLPHTFATKPTGSTFHVTVTTNSQQITWDPKIKITPPIRSV